MIGLFKKGIKKLLGSRQKKVDLLGCHFYMVPSMDFYIYRIALALKFAPSSRELSLVMSILALLKPGDVFIDVGANVGGFVLASNRKL
jgi:hypothetical protein